MRHGKKNNHLGRKTSHRKLMLSNMACSLIEHKRINTTVAKAKTLRRYIEPILTKSKKDTTHSRRIIFRKLRNKHAVTELFREVSVKIEDRPGGYTRVVKLGNRLGDNADMAMIEFVDFNEIYDLNKSRKKTTRRGRGKKDGDDKNSIGTKGHKSEILDTQETEVDRDIKALKSSAEKDLSEKKSN